MTNRIVAVMMLSFVLGCPPDGAPVLSAEIDLLEQQVSDLCGEVQTLSAACVEGRREGAGFASSRQSTRPMCPHPETWSRVDLRLEADSATGESLLHSAAPAVLRLTWPDLHRPTAFPP